MTKIDLAALEESVIDWAALAPDATKLPKTLKVRPKKAPRPHQKDALWKVKAGLTEANRGKLIMACGTGKTFTSLKIAEELAGAGKRILFLVPSLALLSQTLTEWTQESEPLFVAWDGAASNARTYTPDDIRELLKGYEDPGYTWEIGSRQVGRLPGKSVYVIGRPTAT